MAITKSKSKLEPDGLYTCWQSVTAEIDGQVYDATTGDQLLGSHPLVKHMGDRAFVKTGTPRDELPSVFDEAVKAGDEKAAKSPPPPPPSISPDTRLGDSTIVTRAITSSRAGSARLGLVVHKSDERVRIAPECFAPLVSMVERKRA